MLLGLSNEPFRNANKKASKQHTYLVEGRNMRYLTVLSPASSGSISCPGPVPT